MNTETLSIVEGNKLIAEFMGYRINAYPELRHHNMTKPNETEWVFSSWHIEDFNNQVSEYFKYHSSWGWLMPVVIKIAESSPDFEYVIEMGKTFTSARRRNLDDGRSCDWVDGEPDNRILPIWKSVIQFINQTKQS